MQVEILQNGQWQLLPNATAKHMESNRYVVTITGVPIWVRLTELDNAPLRINGKEYAFRVWGASRTNDRFVLDVLVHSGP